jgi:hypothetical protein
MKHDDKNLYRIVKLLEEQGDEDLINHLALEIGSARIREVMANSDEGANAKIMELMSKIPDKSRRKTSTYYDMQAVSTLSEVLSISTSYISNMANNRNANHLHIEREVARVTNNRTFYNYSVEPGFDIGLKNDPVAFDEDMPRFIRRSIIRFAEEGLRRDAGSASFTIEAFMSRFSRDKKPALYEPYKDRLKEMIRSGEMTKSGKVLTLAPELVGTQNGCTIPEDLQSELWLALKSS